jgi:hypothetical protein
VGEVASIILASILLTVTIDLPFQEVKKIILKEGKYIVVSMYIIDKCWLVSDHFIIHTHSIYPCIHGNAVIIKYAQ